MLYEAEVGGPGIVLPHKGPVSCLKMLHCLLVIINLPCVLGLVLNMGIPR
jgi:hypothetical protein